MKIIECHDTTIFRISCLCFFASKNILRFFLLQKKFKNCNYLFEIIDERLQRAFQFRMIIFTSRSDNVVKWQHLINITFDDACFSAIYEFFFQIIHDWSMILNIILRFQDFSVFLESRLDWGIQNLMSLIKESFSWLIIIENFFAVFHNILINMSETKCMLNRKKNRRNRVYQTCFTAREHEDRIRNVKFLIQFKNLL
jgi:hypothetical protein